LSALERADIITGEYNPMFRILFVASFVLPFFLIASGASAQQGHDACARDVSRFCRAVMNDGDSVVLACLQQHRARLSKACEKVLTDNGQ
jgi:hypothetical protein